RVFLEGKRRQAVLLPDRLMVKRQLDLTVPEALPVERGEVEPRVPEAEGEAPLSDRLRTVRVDRPEALRRAHERAQRRVQLEGEAARWRRKREVGELAGESVVQGRQLLAGGDGEVWRVGEPGRRGRQGDPALAEQVRDDARQILCPSGT